GRFAVGEKGEVGLELRNPGSFAAVLELFDGIPVSAETEELPWRGRIPAGGRTRLDYGVRIMERGVASFDRVHGRRRSLLGFWQRRWREGEVEEVRVYPDYEPVLRFALLSMEARQEQMGIVRKSYAGSSRDFHQLREY